jgi:hypothetical protein
MASPAPSIDEPFVPPSSPTGDGSKPVAAADLPPAFPAADSIAPPDSTDFQGAERNAVGDHATDVDSLGFAPYVEAIAAFLTSPATEPPLTISIEGEWGSGKSSFMLQLEKTIAGPSRRAVFFKELPTALGGYTTPGSLWKAIQDARRRRQPPVIRFNAWRHDKQDALWAAFALAVAARLRHRIGFLRAWRGDLYLFCQRLKGPRGWLELLLLLVSVGIFLGSAYILGQHVLHLGLHKSVADFNLLPSGDKAKKLDELYSDLFSKTAATHGSIAGFFLLAIAGLLKFKDQIKLPIAIDLKKYLATPDYEGHSAFIECFHEDFARLLRAYAGTERVFIFIDDLDRCDVPRAAELMQAINLMIADTGRLVFVLGMDREKVAAGITQKYKDLLPFLPEYAAGVTPGPLTGAGSSPLSFGYSFLEKFIQLSFTLPVMGGRDALEKFLDAMLPREPLPTWRRQVNYYWTPRLAWSASLARWWKRIFGEPVEPKPSRERHPSSESGSAPTASTGTGVSNTAAPQAVQTEARVESLRLKIAEDSKGVRAIVSMVSSIFENNPRRLKQFVSTFRLSLALSSDQGILGRGPARTSVTPQQLGKFGALTMRFPDLRVALADDPELLGKLEIAARTWPLDAKPDQQYWRWLHRQSVRKVLLYGVREVVDTTGATNYEGANPYSLRDLDVSRLLSLLPKVPPPPDVLAHPTSPDATTARTTYQESPPKVEAVSANPDGTQPEQPGSTVDEADQQFNEFAYQYGQIRTTMKHGPARTQAMTNLVREVQDNIKEFAPRSAETILVSQLSQDEDGSRIVALAIACERIGAQNMPWLLNFLLQFRSPFEHYWTIRALLLHDRYITSEIAAQIESSLHTRMEEISKDPGRVNEAQRLLALARSKRGPTPPPESDSLPPSAPPPTTSSAKPDFESRLESDISSESSETPADGSHIA